MTTLRESIAWQGRHATIEIGHMYGTRTVHRVALRPNPGFNGRTNCDRPLGGLDRVIRAGSVVPTQWDSWRLCPECRWVPDHG